MSIEYKKKITKCLIQCLADTMHRIIYIPLTISHTCLSLLIDCGFLRGRDE